MMDADQIGHALDLKRSGGSWRGCCPCCGGSARSGKFILSEKNGKLLWFCHAGCSQSAIRQELTDRGLLARPNESRPQAKYTRDQVEIAELIVLVAEAAIRRNEWPNEQDHAALVRAAGIVRESPRNTTQGRLSAKALRTVHVNNYLEDKRWTR